MDDVGPAILRLQVDEASLEDTKLFLACLIESDELRKRCSSLGMLVSTQPKETREEKCILMVPLLWTLEPPVHDLGVIGFTAKQEAISLAIQAAKPYTPIVQAYSTPYELSKGYTASPVFMTEGKPPKHGRWSNHIYFTGKGGQHDTVGVSKELLQILRALESFWHLSSYLLPETAPKE